MRIRMKSFLLMFCLFAAIAANAKEEPIQLFPRTYGYFSRGDSETQTITYDHAFDIVEKHVHAQRFRQNTELRTDVAVADNPQFFTTRFI